MLRYVVQNSKSFHLPPEYRPHSQEPSWTEMAETLLWHASKLRG